MAYHVSIDSTLSGCAWGNKTRSVDVLPANRLILVSNIMGKANWMYIYHRIRIAVGMIWIYVTPEASWYAASDLWPYGENHNDR